MSGPLVLDGKQCSKIIEESLKERVKIYQEKHNGKVPTLATILVGNDPASATYVKMKGNACARVGMQSLRIALPESTTTEQLINEINRLNNDPSVNGILLQHPVPGHIDERVAFDTISAGKDVDGVTCLGFGLMTMGCEAYGSATPTGIMEILEHYKIEITGKHAVVIGRSPILGKPVAMMLLNKNATVTICHSRTKNLPDIVRQADIVVAAVGKPEFVQGSWIKEGAVIVDAGYHPGNVGDVNLKDAIPHCSAYTPVPGGVGPMTIASLIKQTMDSAERIDHA